MTLARNCYWKYMLLLVCFLFCFQTQVDAQVFNNPNEPQLDESILKRFAVMPYEQVVAELDQGEPIDCVRYAIVLVSLADRRGEGALMGRYLKYALGKAQIHKLARKEAEVWGIYSLLSARIKSFDAAIEQARKAAKIFDLLGDNQNYLITLNYIAGHQEVSGKIVEALETQNVVLGLARQSEDEGMLASAIYNVAMLKYKTGQSGNSELSLKEALGIFRRLENENGMGDCLKALGNQANANGYTAIALDYYKQASEHYGRSNNMHGQANCSYNSALCYETLGMIDQAIQSYYDSINLFMRFGDPVGAGMSISALGTVYSDKKQYREAISILLLGRQLLMKGQSLFRLASTERNLAKCYYFSNDLEGALPHAQEAVRLYTQLRLQDQAEEARAQLLRIKQAVEQVTEIKKAAEQPNNLINELFP